MICGPSCAGRAFNTALVNTLPPPGLRSPRIPLNSKQTALPLWTPKSGDLPVFRFGEWFARFGKIDVGCQFAERHARPDVPRFIEDRRPQPAIPKAAAQGRQILVTFDSAGQPLRGHGLANRLFHFDQNESTVPPSALFRSKIAWPVVPLPANESSMIESRSAPIERISLRSAIGFGVGNGASAFNSIASRFPS